MLRASHALAQATVGAGTVIKVYIGVAYTRGGVHTAHGVGIFFLRRFFLRRPFLLSENGFALRSIRERAKSLLKLACL